MHSPDKEPNTASLIQIIDTGDLFASGMQTLVNPVNCKGAMGKGLALLFKQQYPQMFKDYQQRCNSGLVKLGEPYLWKKTPSSPTGILNFPTKGHWSNKSNLRDIRNGLQYLAQHATEWGITSLAIPALGCGLGGLPWEQVLPEIETHLAPLQIPIWIYKEGPNFKTTARKRKHVVQHAPASETPSIALENFFTKKTKPSSPLKTPLPVEQTEEEIVVSTISSLQNN